MNKFFVISSLLVMLTGVGNAHQLTPTYPKFESTFMNNIVMTQVELFNTRKEVNYYELTAFDKNWNPINFVTNDRIVKINHLETKKIDVYIKKSDLKNIGYICTESKFEKDRKQLYVVSTKICSKIK